MQKTMSIISYLNRLIHRCHGIIAVSLLALMFVLGLNAMVHNSAIIDEVAHISAAYSSDHYGDYRLNPEHPPLIKNLAGLPLQFMHLNFPAGPKDAWTTAANAEWDTGWQFLYASGNNAGALLFWARLPILILAVAFGGFLYLWARRRFGTGTALLSLFFYTLSPNILANSNLVTTDLGAAIFIFVALITFVRYIERPNRFNLLLLALSLTVAELTKFSAVILYPFLLFITFYITFAWHKVGQRQRWLKAYSGGLILASLISLILVWLYYIPLTINTPASVQQRLIANALTYGPGHGIGQFMTGFSTYPMLKPLVQYVLGLTMVLARVAGGNTTYFMGQVTNQSFHAYFPVLFTLKTQLSFLIIGSAGIIWAAVRVIKRRPLAIGHHLASYSRRHFVETVLGLFAIFYFTAAVLGNLNLGLRHILPIYIPLFVLASLAIVRYSWRLKRTSARVWYSVILALLLAWYAAATVWISPSFLAYFNELIGGPGNANAYFSDSSLDWGQDLTRLETYMVVHNIDTAAVDYFGGAQLSYYFPPGLKPSVVGWHAQDKPYSGQYIAVSETYLENDIYYSKKDGYAGYIYLRGRKPIAKIGYSIYLYKLY
jgi:hypothetical protein